MEKRERDASQMLTARFHWEQKILTPIFFRKDDTHFHWDADDSRTFPVECTFQVVQRMTKYHKCKSNTLVLNAIQLWYHSLFFIRNFHKKTRDSNVEPTFETFQHVFRVKRYT